MPYANLGVVDNKGFEATLEYTQQLGKKCFLTVRGNFSWNEDKIIENDDPRVQYPWMEKKRNERERTLGMDRRRVIH